MAAALVWMFIGMAILAHIGNGTPWLIIPAIALILFVAFVARH